jgi:hypothetical protein
MLGFGKPPKTEAQILADHVKTATEAKAKGDWATAADHFGRASQMTYGAGQEPHFSYFEATVACEKRIDRAKVQARRKELGLS